MAKQIINFIMVVLIGYIKTTDEVRLSRTELHNAKRRICGIRRLFPSRHLNDHVDKENPGSPVNGQIEPIDPLHFSALVDAFELLPDMWMWCERSQAKR